MLHRAHLSRVCCFLVGNDARISRVQICTRTSNWRNDDKRQPTSQKQPMHYFEQAQLPKRNLTRIVSSYHGADLGPHTFEGYYCGLLKPVTDCSEVFGQTPAASRKRIHLNWPAFYSRLMYKVVSKDLTGRIL
jgi:hypothetical protein